MLLLIVMSLLAMYMFRSNGVQELIAGNIREKQRSIQTAEAAEQLAEMWLATPGNVVQYNSVPCTSAGVVAWPTVPVICTAPVASITDAANATTVPWKVSGAEVGFTYFPGSTTGTGDLNTATVGPNYYYQVPRFYIGIVQNQSSIRQAVYRIDAWNYAGTPNTATVVESNFVVTNTNANLGN